MQGSSFGSPELKIENLSLSFGGITALHDLNLQVDKGEIFGIIGPNGAGKTSTLNCINGFYRVQKGDVFFRGQNITKLSPEGLAKLGISRTFQNIQLYTGLTVGRQPHGRQALPVQVRLGRRGPLFRKGPPRGSATPPGR